MQHILSRGSRGEPPKCVLAITFTKAAAEEMQQRLGKALGRAADAVVVSTFHALTPQPTEVQICRESRYTVLTCTSTPFLSSVPLRA